MSRLPKKRQYQMIEKLVAKVANAIPVHELDRMGVDAVQVSKKIQIKYTTKDKIYFSELQKYKEDIEIYICFVGFEGAKKTYTIYQLIPQKPTNATQPPLILPALSKNDHRAFGEIFYICSPFQRSYIVKHISI